MRPLMLALYVFACGHLVAQTPARDWEAELGRASKMEAAQRDLVQMGDGAESILRGAVKSKEATVRRHALYVLQRIDRPWCTEVAGMFVRDGDPNVQSEAIDAVLWLQRCQEWGYHGPEGDPKVAELRTLGPVLLPAIKRGLAHWHQGVWFTALVTLSKWSDPAALDALLEFIETGDADYLFYLPIEGLRRFSDPRILPALVRNCWKAHSGSGFPNPFSAELIRLDDKALPVIASTLRKMKDWDHRWWLIPTLQEMTRGWVILIQLALSDPHREVRLGAVLSLRYCDNTEVRRALRKLTGDRDSEIAKVARDSLDYAVNYREGVRFRSMASPRNLLPPSPPPD